MADPGVDGRIILRWIFRKWDVGTRNGSRWPRIGTGGVNEPSGSIKCREFFESLKPVSFSRRTLLYGVRSE